MKPDAIRKLTNVELTNKKTELTQESFNLKFQLHTCRLENTAKLRNIRKDIARISTILNENSVGSNR